MIHQFFIVGTIKKINVNEPKDPKKSASAVMLVQYGPSRDTTGNAVEFVNAVMVRVPSYRYPQLKPSLELGAKVSITGHLQGVYKSLIDDAIFTTELVADKVYLEKENEDAPSAE